jgi:hypothetical protein
MTFSDYLLDSLLIGIVVLQIRGRRLTLRSLLLPVGIVAYVAFNYLRGIPTAGNDVLLVGLATIAGTGLGLLCGLFTDVREGPGGSPFAKAGLVAAALWVAGVGTRLAFQLYATHGGGGAIARFSAAHAITSSQAWVAALILMAMGEALARTAVLAYRGYRVAPAHFLRQPAIMGAGDRAF